MALGHRLAKLDERPRVALVTPQLSHEVRDQLSTIWRLHEVPALTTGSSEELTLLGRPELDVSVTKIYAWTLPYDQVVYLDADTLPLKPLSDLDAEIDLGSIAAAPDVGWPDIFNSGVFACRPDTATFEGLKDLIKTSTSFDGSDQGLLNEFFAQAWNRLPFVYNVTLSASYQYEPAYRRFKSDIRVLHFIGKNKPWKPASLQADSVAANEMMYLWKKAAIEAGLFKHDLPPEAERSTIDYDPKRIIHPDPQRWEGDRFAPMRGGKPEGRPFARPATPAPGSPIISDEAESDEAEEPEASDQETTPVVYEENAYVFPVFGPEVIKLPFEHRRRKPERVFY